jgi:hypothetical protein
MRSAALLIGALVAGLTHPTIGAAQTSPEELPKVVFRFDPTYQAVVMRGSGGNAEDDIRWAERRAEDLTDFYASHGPELLGLLAKYAGLRWPYREIEVYVVRNFPTLSIQYPLTLTVGSIRQDESKQDVPSGDFLLLTFAHQITHYLLDPPPEELATSRPVVVDRHPLMQESNYGREALVNLVTYRALRDFWGAERLRKVVQHPLWASYNPESAFVDSLQAGWELSESRPLVSWLQSESTDGRLVRLAERLERGERSSGGRGEKAEAPVVPGTLSGNEFGFDLGQSAEGRLFISFLDPRSPAENAGLHSGDVVATIEGRRFSSASEAIRAARDAWETNQEVNLSVEREGREIFFQVH